MILLDTHVVVWLGSDPARISKRATAAIRKSREENGGLAISCISLFEIAHLAARGRIQVARDIHSYLSEIEHHFEVMPITGGVAAASVQFPERFPGDPMDRLIAATAIVEQLLLVTADERIQKSRVVETIW